jgi:hypothetical protein
VVVNGSRASRIRRANLLKRAAAVDATIVEAFVRAMVSPVKGAANVA